MIRKNQIAIKARHAKVSRAFSLLEVTAVIALMGVFGAMAVTTFGHKAIANAAAKGYARKLSLDFLQAQRRSITDGDNFLVQFQSSAGTITGHRVYQRSGGSTTAVDDLRTVPSDVTVTSAFTECEYTFEGSALTSFTCTVAGPDRSWQVQVIQLTGTVRVTEL